MVGIEHEREKWEMAPAEVNLDVLSETLSTSGQGRVLQRHLTRFDLCLRRSTMTTVKSWSWRTKLSKIR